MAKRCLAVVLICAFLFSVPMNVLAGVKAPAEEAGKEESADTAEAESFIAGLRDAMDARLAAEAEADAEDVNAPYKAEMELMLKYMDQVFEDNRLQTIASLYRYSLSGIIYTEWFRESASYYGVLDTSFKQQYAIALLLLNEEYALPLSEEEMDEYRSLLEAGQPGEAGDGGEDAAEAERVTAGHYSFVVPEGFMCTEDENGLTLSAPDGSTSIGILARDAEEVLEQYESYLQPYIPELYIMSLQEEQEDLRSEPVLDAEFAGYAAKRLSAVMNFQGDEVYFDTLAAVTDKDYVVIVYSSDKVDDVEGCRQEADQLIASAREITDEASGDEAEAAEEADKD